MNSSSHPNGTPDKNASPGGIWGLLGLGSGNKSGETNTSPDGKFSPTALPINLNQSQSYDIIQSQSYHSQSYDDGMDNMEEYDLEEDDAVNSGHSSDMEFELNDNLGELGDVVTGPIDDNMEPEHNIEDIDVIPPPVMAFIPPLREYPSNIPEDAYESIFNSAIEGNLRKLLEIFRDYADARDVCDDDGCTPFVLACKYGHESMVDILHFRGSDLNHRANDGSTALVYAASSGNATIAKMLLAHGADMTFQGSLGKTALLIACEKDNRELIKLFLSNPHKSTLSASIPCDNYTTPLYYTSVNNDVESCALLLEQGADINARNLKGETSLYAAVAAGCTEVVSLLLSKGAFLNIKVSYDCHKFIQLSFRLL